MTTFELAVLMELHNIAGILITATKKKIYGGGKETDNEFEHRINIHNQLTDLIIEVQKNMRKEYQI